MLLRHQPVGVCVRAPAKLNLFLRVLGKRVDGYHELETLMMTIGLYDVVRASPRDDGQLAFCWNDVRPPGRPVPSTQHHRPFAAGIQPTSSSALTTTEQASSAIPHDAGNLVLRAAQLIKDYARTSCGATLSLTKRIPVAAGLGGGSSDAAATLVALNRLWKLQLTADELHRLATQLGSDVPFFLCPTGAAVCRGRGELITPVRCPATFHFVIARPPSGLSTALVFQHCRPTTVDWSANDVARSLSRGRLSEAASQFYNSLEAPAITLNADVARLQTAFARLPFSGRMMSGSGTSYFGICKHRRQAQQLSARLRATRLGDVFQAPSRP